MKEKDLKKQKIKILLLKKMIHTFYKKNQIKKLIVKK